MPLGPEIRSVGAGFVAGVGGGLELEGGVLDVEVPGDAGLQLVQQPRSAAVGEAGVVKSRYA
jgi:hypothetical protein